MRYYVIAGEPSGDLQGAALLKAIRAIDHRALFRGIGGDAMQANGLKTFARIEALAYIGFTRILYHLPSLLRLRKCCRADLLAFKPHALILIDAPGFNLSMVSFAKKKGIKTFYYILPKVWAWGRFRIKRLRGLHGLYAILPFEKDFYQRHGIDNVHYVGHPLCDMVAAYQKEKSGPQTATYDVGLLPGSRIQEVKSHAKVFARIAKAHTALSFAVAALRGLPHEWYAPLKKCQNVVLHYDDAYKVLAHVKVAVVASGTAVLETALWQVPQIVYYRIGFFLKIAKKLFLLTPYVSLVNLIANKTVVLEIISMRARTTTLIKETKRLYTDKEYQRAIKQGYKEVEKKLEAPNGLKKAATHLIESLQNA